MSTNTATSKRWGHGARVDDLNKGKSLLLRAAIECFVTKGVKATTVEDVAEAANVTRRTVYRYYAGKQEIIAAVVDLQRKRMFAQMREAVAEFHDDFPRLVAECIHFASSYQQPQDGRTDFVAGLNTADARRHLAAPESDEEWFKILREPYEQHRARRGDFGSLEDLIKVIGRLVICFRQLPASREDVLASVNALRRI